MATIPVKLVSCTFGGASKAGALMMRYNQTAELIDDGSDGAVFEREPAVSIKRMRIEVDFKYADTLTGLSVGTKGALVCVAKEGKGGSNATLTFANAIIEDTRLTTDGSSGTAIFRAYSTDGTTSPLTVT